MKKKDVILLYYLLSALTSGAMGFFMGVYSNFLRANLNNDEFLVNMVNVCFFVVITISEIPTGLFADIFGRKGSFVISCFLEMIAFAIYGISKNFWGFVLAESIGAVGKTFASGAFEAWLVDSIKHDGEKIDFLKIFARRSLISRSSIITTSIIGGWLGDKELNIPFFATSLTYAVCGIIAILKMKETYFEKSKFSFTTGLKQINETWHKSLVFTKSDIRFRFILIIGAIQMFAFMAPNMEWQKVFKELGFNNSLNGIIGGFINIAMITGVILSRRVSQHFKEEKKQMVFTMIFTGICIILTVSFKNICPVVIFFFLHEIGRGAIGPIMESYTQNSITSSKERATLSSFGSMVGHLGGAIGLLVSGLIAKQAGISLAWIVSGTVLVITTLLTTRKYQNKK
jgi:MFS family permease